MWDRRRGAPAPRPMPPVSCARATASGRAARPPSAGSSRCPTGRFSLGVRAAAGIANPDATLIASGDAIIASADRVVMDGCARWANLAREVIARHVPEAKVVDLAVT